jgi:hypothetical protein
MHRNWWKAYFFLALAIAVAIMALPLYVYEEGPSTDWRDWMDVPLYMMQLIGLFGFAYWRRIGAPVVWQIVFLGSLAYSGWSWFSMATDPDLLNAGHEALIVLSILGSLLLEAPLLIALFLYGFKCRALWRRDIPAPS